jgi:hypothetical protein
MSQNTKLEMGVAVGVVGVFLLLQILDFIDNIVFDNRSPGVPDPFYAIVGTTIMLVFKVSMKMFKNGNGK